MKFYQSMLLLLLLVTTVSADPKKGKKKCPDPEGDLKKYWRKMSLNYALGLLMYSCRFCS